jgi:transcription elongation factor Elf1
MKTRSIDIAEIKAKFGPAKQTQQRVGDLRLRLVRDFQCPHCEIENKRRSLLVPVQKPSSGSILRCYFCGEDFPAPDRE